MSTTATYRSRETPESISRAEDFELFMRPIVRILLLLRISMPAFIALIKKLYLEEARNMIERRGEDVTVPKLAFEAGCTEIGLVSDFIKGRRKTLVDIGDLPSVGNDRDAVPLLTLEGIIIDRWKSDPLYRDADGNPVRLPVRGPAGRSFDGLVRRCVSGRMSYGPILETLKQAKAIRHDPETDEVSLVITDPGSAGGNGSSDASASASSESAMYVRTDREDSTRIRIGARIHRLAAPDLRNLRSALESTVRGIAHLASTCCDNLRLVVEGQADQAVFQRLQLETFSVRLPPDKYWEFKALSRGHLLDTVNRWVSRAERLEASAATDPLCAGIGVYFWDTRPDVYDTERIGMPEILPPEEDEDA